MCLVCCFCFDENANLAGGPCTNIVLTAYAHVRTEPQCDIGQTRRKKDPGNPILGRVEPCELLETRSSSHDAENEIAAVMVFWFLAGTARWTAYRSTTSTFVAIDK